jgi:malate dehydrogenase
VSGIPVTELVDAERLNAIIERTKFGGGELVNLMGTSAWYAPGAAAAQMAVSILKNERRIYPCCVRLTGQYGIDDLFVGAPVKLGRQGIEHVIELKLTEEEKALLHRSAAAVREVVQVLDNMNIL